MSDLMKPVDDTDLSLATKVRAKKPSLYRVLLINDDYTPMEFVVEVLESFFEKNHSEATQIMLAVHKQGKGICGVYPHGIAETKVAQVNEYSRRHQHPLQCTMEKA
jgi:ATP-dependent Clp protease adaptor protein ClpS